MTDLFDWLIRQEIEPEMDVRPVLQPIFPLVIPGQDTGAIMLVSLFSAASEEPADPALNQQEEPRPARQQPEVQTQQNVLAPGIRARITPAPMSTVTDDRQETYFAPAQPSTEEQSIMMSLPSGLWTREEGAQLEAITPMLPRAAASTVTARPVTGATEVSRTVEISPTSSVATYPFQGQSEIFTPVILPMPTDDLQSAQSPVTPPVINRQPEVRISIGRIDVRTVASLSVPKTKPANSHTPHLSLDQYLRSRGEG